MAGWGSLSLRNLCRLSAGVPMMSNTTSVKRVFYINVTHAQLLRDDGPQQGDKA